MHLTKEEMERINEAGRRGRAIYEAEQAGKLTRAQADARLFKECEEALYTKEAAPCKVIEFPTRGE